MARKALNNSVFAISTVALEERKIHGDKVVNATLGAIYNEDAEMVTFDSVWNLYDKIPHSELATYAAVIHGNDGFRKAIKDWFVPGFDCNVIASVGGTGALFNTLRTAMDAGQKVLYPSLAWGAYKIMMDDYDQMTYELFDGDGFNVTDFKKQTKSVMDSQGKVMVVINDPCHNPTGYSMELDEWVQVMNHLNELAEQGEVYLLNDIAYIDFTKDKQTSRQHFELFNDIHENLIVVVAVSCSKTLTAYGVRLGAQVIIAKDTQKREDFAKACTFNARGTWSNVNNGGMVLFDKLINIDENKEAFIKEKDGYVEILSQRSNVFLKEAKEVGLEHYPHKEGFFVTLKITDPVFREKVYYKLNDNLIFPINIDNGIRIALCSAPLWQIKGLAKRIKDVIDEVKAE